MRRVLITPRSLTRSGFDAVPELEPLRARNYVLVSAPAGRLPSTGELIELVTDCDGWLAGIETIDETVLASAPALKVISRNGVGTDAIDLEAAARHGVEVRVAAGANAQGVAELALALALCALRHIPWASAALRDGRWERQEARELSECTVGIIGLGAVGRRSAQLFAAVGAHVVGHDPWSTLEGVPSQSLDELLAESDVITLHCPPTGDKPLIDSTAVAAMKLSTVLVNTARSALVDNDAVCSGLESGRLLSYAVDAFDREPPQQSALLSNPRVIATPHLGAFTGASVRRATRQAVANLIAALEAP